MPKFVKGGPNPSKPGVNRNPSGMASRMTTLITMALRERIAMVDPKTKTTVAERIAEIMVRCITDPDPEVDKTRLTAISEVIDRCEGKAKQQIDVNDVTADLRSRSDHDLLYHLEHGVWPEEQVQ
jgi:hypothetical protein